MKYEENDYLLLFAKHNNIIYLSVVDHIDNVESHTSPGITITDILCSDPSKIDNDIRCDLKNLEQIYNVLDVMRDVSKEEAIARTLDKHPELFI